MKKGERVIALADVTGNVVRFFGAGKYSGDHVPPANAGGLNFGIPNPKIDLDDGKTVWGCESWWGPEIDVLKRFPKDKFKWEQVDIEEARKHGLPGDNGK